MIHDMQAIAELDYADKLPIHKVVDEAGIVELVAICNSGATHAYFTERQSMPNGRWLVTIVTRSSCKWHELRDWSC